MKLLVETTGEFGLLNTNSEEISASRPSVVTVTDFIEGRTAKGDLKILGKLNDKADDIEFMALCREYTTYPTKGKIAAPVVDHAAAVGAFLSIYKLEELTAK